MKSFRELGLSEALLKSIIEHKFEKPSEIQEKTIPLVLAGKDVIGGSATGSGKTLAFGAGIIEHTQKGRGIQSLILVPTRELAEQVAKSLRNFSRHKDLEIISVYGGLSINPQIEGLMDADIVIGTPGRILDHLERRTIDLSRVKILVLDEADRMLDMGFIRDVEKIIRVCPHKRQTLMFSATIPQELDSLARNYMHNPESISAESYVDPSKLRQVYYDIQGNMKFSALVYLLKKETAVLVMVFCNTREGTDYVTKNLRLSGIHALAVHGGFSQGKRESTMEKFHAKDVQVLVCTDVAARGLDIQQVSHVYNYDIPKTSKEYIHRIGRTARAGKEGIAISLVSERDYENFSRIEDDKSLNIEKEALPFIPKIETRRFDSPRSRRPMQGSWHRRGRDDGDSRGGSSSSRRGGRSDSRNFGRRDRFERDSRRTRRY